MSEFVIICVNNKLNSNWLNELKPLNQFFEILAINSTSDYKQLLNKTLVEHRQIALIVFSILQNKQQTLSIISEINQSPNAYNAKTLAIGLENEPRLLIDLINQQKLDYCLQQTWKKNALCKQAQSLLTSFIQEYHPQKALNYSAVLDAKALLDFNVKHKLTDYFDESNSPSTDVELSEQLVNELNRHFKSDEQNRLIDYSPNHVLTREGLPNLYLWFIIEGEVSLIKKGQNSETFQIAHLKKGSLIGSMSFISGDVSFSTGITLTKTKVLKVDRKQFNELMHKNNELLPLFTRYLLRHYNQRLASSFNTKVILEQTLQDLEIAHNELINKEKMALLGQLIAGVAHELNNPISAILRNTDQLESLIFDLINSDLSCESIEKAKSIMSFSLLSNPISTSVARERAKKIDSKVKDVNLARKIVNMDLDDEIDVWKSKLADKLPIHLAKWYQFHQAGKLMRSNQICAKRIADMVKSLKSYARANDEVMKEVDVHEGIEDTLVIFENRIKHINLIREYQKLNSIVCKPIALQQLWTNLISNALDALTDIAEAELKITTKNVIQASFPAIEVCIEDNGSGIDFDIQQKIFELNYTTKKEGHFGLGIGLSICKQIVEDHGGRIEIRSEPNKFTAFTVILPMRPLCVF